MYFGYGWDNGWTIYLDDDHYVNKFIVNQVNNGTFNQYGNANKWYSVNSIKVIIVKNYKHILKKSYVIWVKCIILYYTRI